MIVAGAVLVTKEDDAEASRRLSGGIDATGALVQPAHARQPTLMPGVILRRGNYFGQHNSNYRPWSSCNERLIEESEPLILFVALSLSVFFLCSPPLQARIV